MFSTADGRPPSEAYLEFDFAQRMILSIGVVISEFFAHIDPYWTELLFLILVGIIKFNPLEVQLFRAKYHVCSAMVDGIDCGGVPEYLR
jgi:hypothetical protein